MANAAVTDISVTDGDALISTPGYYRITGSGVIRKIHVYCSGTVNITFDNVTIDSGTVTLADTGNTKWNDGSTDDKTYTFTIGQKDAPVFDDINESYNWAATGQKTVTVSGLPDDMGTVGTAALDITDGVTFLMLLWFMVRAESTTRLTTIPPKKSAARQLSRSLSPHRIIRTSQSMLLSQ